MTDEPTNIPSAQSLKLCGACGALNHGGNCCCCNCSWEGSFDTDETRVLSVIKSIEEDVERILQRELTDKIAWTRSVTVHIKSLLFSVKKVEDCRHFQHNPQAACD